MPLEWTTLHVLAVIFLATVIRSGFGFGEALIAVPLLALVMPVEVAAPLAVLFSITVAVIVLIQDWRKVHVQSAMWLVVSTLFGIPLGLFLLTTVEEAIIKAILAVCIIGFSVFCLAGRVRLELRNDKLVWAFGFIAGILGGAYGMNGPPLVVYGSLRRWSPEHFRATLQGYFLPASIIGTCGYWWTGIWSRDVNHYYVVSLPVALAAIFLGRWINRRIKAEAFIAYVHVGLIVIGSILLVQSIWQEKRPILVQDETFEFQLGQGSGWHGLDLLKITADGKAVYEYQSSRGEWERKTFFVDKASMDALICKINSLKIMELDRAYHGDVADGTQWCLLIKSNGRAKSVYCDNNFPERIEKLAAFVHETIIEPFGGKAEARAVPPRECRKHEKEIWESIK
jgi:uncharacterized membrane protein YfcA